MNILDPQGPIGAAEKTILIDSLAIKPLREVAKRFEVVGADFVEVSPPYDPSGITSLLAARTSLDFIGSIFHERAKRRAPDIDRQSDVDLVLMTPHDAP